jgi:hypothetical protein
MCQNAAKTAAALLSAEEPTLKSLLTYTNLINTPEGIAVIAAYDAADTALAGWKSGTTAQNVLELLADFQNVFNTLPLPSTVTVLANLILAGIETVIGVLTANSPAPAAPAGTPPVAEPQALHQAVVAHDTVTKVHALVPGIKLSRFHGADVQYKNAWNAAVEKGGFPASLKA